MWKHRTALELRLHPDDINPGSIISLARALQFGVGWLLVKHRCCFLSRFMTAVVKVEGIARRVIVEFELMFTFSTTTSAPDGLLRCCPYSAEKASALLLAVTVHP
ncbi:unnamed protein product [Coffea canephora]|uniref:Uncharacterized protein n=1 Tax=Coffea canephora TaxID=49390 RepID=A0A068TUG9_COFCA|nr:unnamed protein product [Coffea canephora]